MGEYVIVTGASLSRAFEEGFALAEGLVRAGFLVSMWDSDPSVLEGSASELDGLGPTPDLRAVDVANADDVRDAYAAVKDSLGPPNALFNMATLRNTFMLGERSGRSGPLPFWELDLGRLRRTVEVNVLGSIFCSSVVAPDMVVRGSGSIVNFSTSLSTQHSSTNIPYGPSKAMVEAFSDGASKTLQPHGVRMNVIASGGAVNRRGETDPDRVPYDWAWKLAAYLAGDDSRNVTGQLFTGSGLSPRRQLSVEST